MDTVYLVRITGLFCISVPGVRSIIYRVDLHLVLNFTAGLTEKNANPSINPTQRNGSARIEEKVAIRCFEMYFDIIPRTV